MRMDDSEFERYLNQSGVSAEELRQMEDAARLSPFGVTPITPHRRELLSTLVEVLEVNKDLRVNGQWAQLSAEFSERVVPWMDVRPKDRILVKNPLSYQDDERIMPGADGANIIGGFAMMDIQPWYDVSFDEADFEELVDGEPPEMLETVEYTEMQSGLYVHVHGAVIALPGVEGHRDIGNVQIPLNHGTPDIYRMFQTR